MSLTGRQLAGSGAKRGREVNDYYATNPETVEIFLRELHKEIRLEGKILECACGCGNIAKVLEKYYEEVEGIDLVYRGYGKGGIDFLLYEPEEEYGTIITNPPFSKAKEFIEKGLKLSNKYVIMLCKIQLLEGVSRREFLKESPLKYVYVHSTRQATWLGGREVDEKGKKWSTTMCLAWYVWEKGYRGEPVIRWL